MTDHPIRVYADTSVYGALFDEEFAKPTQAFFDQVRSGRLRRVVSAVVKEELSMAPEFVQALLNEMTPYSDHVVATREATDLQQAYLDAGIVTPRWMLDAVHVAMATVSACRAIVSWNFRHIVSFQNIPLYNGVNLARGYAPVAIHSPQELVADDDEAENI